MKRIFLIVLDSFGVGAMPDSESFGDVGVNTLASCATSNKLHIPNMIAAGLGNMDGVSCLPKVDAPTGAFCRLSERSMGKDTTIGHWEIAGLVSNDPLPTYPDGFPEEVLAPFRAATGRGVLANAPWSGTAVLDEFGEEHMKSGDLISFLKEKGFECYAASVSPQGSAWDRACELYAQLSDTRVDYGKHHSQQK